jgi:F-type H+-transporting ATPase subunit c
MWLWPRKAITKRFLFNCLPIGEREMSKMKYVIGAAATLMPAVAFAEGAVQDAGQGRPMYALAKGFAVGAAALGCALGQSRIVSAALDGIGRNPGAREQIFTPMLLGVVFVETLLIFTLFASGISL